VAAQPLGHPRFGVAQRQRVGVGGAEPGADDLLEGHALQQRELPQIGVVVEVLLVAQDEPVVGVVENERLAGVLDRVAQDRLGARRALARLDDLPLAVLEVGHVAIDRDDAAFGGAMLGRVDRAAAGQHLLERSAWPVVPAHALGGPRRVLGVAAIRPGLPCGQLDDFAERHARSQLAAQILEEVLVAAVPGDQPVLGVVEHEAVAHAFDAVAEAPFAGAQRRLRIRDLAGLAQQPGNEQQHQQSGRSSTQHIVACDRVEFRQSLRIGLSDGDRQRCLVDAMKARVEPAAVGLLLGEGAALEIDDRPGEYAAPQVGAEGRRPVARDAQAFDAIEADE